MVADIFGTFSKGGLVMYPILLCSIFSVAITIERLFFYKECDSGTSFLQSLTALLAEKKATEVLELTKASSGDCAALVASCLQGSKLNLSLVETKANLMLETYDEHLGFLSIIVTASPLLGLLGTILGMMSAFKVFDLRAGQPFAITSGIGEALIATAFGLIVAILALVLHGFLKYRAANLAKRLTQCCSALEVYANGGEQDAL